MPTPVLHMLDYHIIKNSLTSHVARDAQILWTEAPGTSGRDLSQVACPFCHANNSVKALKESPEKKSG